MKIAAIEIIENARVTWSATTLTSTTNYNAERGETGGRVGDGRRCALPGAELVGQSEATLEAACIVVTAAPFKPVKTS